MTERDRARQLSERPTLRRRLVGTPDGAVRIVTDRLATQRLPEWRKQLDNACLLPRTLHIHFRNTPGTYQRT